MEFPATVVMEGGIYELNMNKRSLHTTLTTDIFALEAFCVQIRLRLHVYCLLIAIGTNAFVLHIIQILQW